MARPSYRGYVARGRGEVHPAFRTLDLVLIRELLLSLAELLLLQFQLREVLLIPELLLLLQLQLPLVLLELSEVLLLLLLELLLSQELLPAHPFELVPWGGRSFLGKIAQGVLFPWGALVAVERAVS